MNWIAAHTEQIVVSCIAGGILMLAAFVVRLLWSLLTVGEDDSKPTSKVEQRSTKYAPRGVAQSVERRVVTPEAAGSKPASPATKKETLEDVLHPDTWAHKEPRKTSSALDNYSEFIASTGPVETSGYTTVGGVDNDQLSYADNIWRDVVRSRKRTLFGTPIEELPDACQKAPYGFAQMPTEQRWICTKCKHTVDNQAVYLRNADDPDPRQIHAYKCRVSP